MSKRTGSSRKRWLAVAGWGLLLIGMLAGCAAPPAPSPTETAVPTTSTIAGATVTVPASPIDPWAGSDETVDFRSPVAGFSLQVPANWTIDDTQQGAVAIEFPMVIGSLIGVRAGFFLLGAPLADIGVSNLDGLWTSFSASLSATAVVDPPSELSVDGHAGYQARFVDSEIQAQGWLITVLSEQQGYVLIGMVQPPVHFETFQPVFEAMLGSTRLFAPEADVPTPQS